MFRACYNAFKKRHKVAAKPSAHATFSDTKASPPARPTPSSPHRLTLFDFPSGHCESTKDELRRFSADIEDDDKRLSFRHGHHKFPKRSLGWIYCSMTKAQRAQLATTLQLADGFTAGDLARLPSNIISANSPAGKITGSLRRDDPDHGGKIRDLDLVRYEGGQLTPRSAHYLNLADICHQIKQRMQQEKRTRFTDAEAQLIIDALESAENEHRKIQSDKPDLPCDYGEDFWQFTPPKSPRSQQTWSKSPRATPTPG